jgi:hypothetical protein
MNPDANSIPDRDEHTLDEARTRISRLALGLTRALGDLDAAGSLIGSGATVLIQSRGVEFASDYLRMLADELDQAGDDPMAGHEH